MLEENVRYFLENEKNKCQCASRNKQQKTPSGSTANASPTSVTQEDKEIVSEIRNNHEPMVFDRMNGFCPKLLISELHYLTQQSDQFR